MRYLFTLLFALLITTSARVNASDRYWEQWDVDGVAELIDSYWVSSQEEMSYRGLLANFLSQRTAPCDSYLDIGCGSGLVYQHLVPRVFSSNAYVGIDVSPAMLSIAASRYPQGNFQLGDVYNLSFEDNSFDIVAAFEVFGHIEDIRRPIKEMFRVAAKTMIFSVWTAPQTVVTTEQVKKAVFIHVAYSHADLEKLIVEALAGECYGVEIEHLSASKVAYIIHKMHPLVDEAVIEEPVVEELPESMFEEAAIEEYEPVNDAALTEEFTMPEEAAILSDESALDVAPEPTEEIVG